MSLHRLERLSTALVHKNPYWDYRLDLYLLPDGNVSEYHYVHTPGSSVIVPVMDDGRLVFVRQMRYLWQRVSIEFPAGGVKNGDFLETAKNELAEEANFSAREWIFVGQINPMNGITDEVCNVYIARCLSPAYRQRDPSEEFEIILLSKEEFKEKIRKGEIWDGMTLAAWSLVIDRLNSINKMDGLKP
ncbi:MAG: NUDIX domain-containing protein [Candidatus Kryptoniota bacterium]